MTVTAPGVGETVDAWFDQVSALGRRDRASRSSGSTDATTSSTTEAFATYVQITATLVSGRIYIARFSGVWYGTVVGDIAQFNIRYAAGSSVSSSGTTLTGGRKELGVCVANASMDLSLLGEMVAPSSAQYTFGVAIQRQSGSGTVGIRQSGSNYPIMILECGAA